MNTSNMPCGNVVAFNDYHARQTFHDLESEKAIDEKVFDEIVDVMSIEMQTALEFCEEEWDRFMSMKIDFNTASTGKVLLFARRAQTLRKRLSDEMRRVIEDQT